MIQKLCHFIFFKLLRWRVVGEIPTIDKYIFVAIPHTSNWDFVYAWMALRALGLEVTIFVKDAFFVWPLNYVCKFFGVAPVNRRESTNFVDSIARQYAENDRLAAIITPEGTRKYNSELKSGYYYLAKKAGVPLVLTGPNYADKSFSILPPRAPLATFEEDAADIIRFSRTITARKPDQTFQ
ncbi:MAG: hypothetical protein HKN85_07170 [Gammaproteobacteria bacterium]|nr:hypothetical protein [Gammaproteobacteria bacterium]